MGTKAYHFLTTSQRRIGCQVIQRVRDTPGDRLRPLDCQHAYTGGGQRTGGRQFGVHRCTDDVFVGVHGGGVNNHRSK